MNRILNTLLFCAITTIATAQTTAAPLGTYNEPNYPYLPTTRRNGQRCRHQYN